MDDIKLYRVGRFPDKPFKGCCLFFSDSPDYYTYSDTGYDRGRAREYIFNQDGFRIFDPMREWGLEADSWSVIRTSEEFAKEKGLEIADYLDGVDYDDPTAYHEVLLDTDSLAMYGRDNGYDATIIRGIPQRNGKSYDEYAIHNSECVKPVDEITEDLDVSMSSAPTYDENDLAMGYVDALITAYFDAEERSGAPRVEERRANCYRPWGHEITVWMARERTNGEKELIGDSPTGGLITILSMPKEDFDKVIERVKGSPLEEDLDVSIGNSREPNVKFDVSSEEGLELIDRFANKRYWYISLSDGSFETVDGFELGGKYAKLRTYDEALKLWQEYPLEEEMLEYAVEENPDEYHESHVLLNCITDAEFEREGNEYDDLAAAENDFRWSESKCVADRFAVYDPEEGRVDTEIR